MIAALALLLAAGTAQPAKAPSEIVAEAPASAWRAIAPEDVMVMELANGRQVAIQLAPGFAPAHVANVRALVRGRWFDDNAVTRVQDGYVTQWGGADAERPLPGGVVAVPPAEYDRALAGLKVRPLGFPDPYSQTGHADGWPVASEGASAWLPHCYGMVGVGRDMPPDTGNGVELYVVIGQGPRALERNIALVGRVIDGMDALSSLRRGTAEMGFYADPKENMAIVRTRMLSDLPAAARPRFEAMDTGSASFTAYLDAKANRRDAFYVRPANALDICNAAVPVRRKN